MFLFSLYHWLRPTMLLILDFAVLLGIVGPHNCSWINYTDFKSIEEVFSIFLGPSFSPSLSHHTIMPKRQWLTARSRWNIMILLEGDRHFELSGLPWWKHAHMHTLTLRSGVNHSISVMKYSLTAVSKLCRWTSLINFCHSPHTQNKSPWKPCLER